MIITIDWKFEVGDQVTITHTQKTGTIYEQVWRNLCYPEVKNDPNMFKAYYISTENHFDLLPETSLTLFKRRIP